MRQRSTTGVFALFQAVATLHDALAAFPSLTDLAHDGYFIDREDVGATTCLVAGGKLETLIGVGDKAVVFSGTSQPVRIGCTLTMTVAAVATERDLLQAARVIAADAQQLQVLSDLQHDHPQPATPM